MIIISPFALQAKKGTVANVTAVKFNRLAYKSGYQMGDHDKKLGKPCNPDNWLYTSDSNQVRRAIFEIAYIRGYGE
jgi:hypothetical protein